jgi:UPF0176 protein
LEPISSEDKQSPLFEDVISCPFCHGTRDAAKLASLAERDRQVKLSQARGEQHIGAVRAKKTQHGMISRPILYSFRRCPYAMRARMALVYSGIRVELREIVLRDKPEELLSISPKATVPVLQLPDGHVIDESLDIIDWALRQNDPDNWLLGAVSALIATNDGPFKAALDRYKYPNRYQLPNGHAYRQKGSEFLAELETRLTISAYLSGKTMGLNDIAIFPFIRQFVATDHMWFEEQEFPRLQHWFTMMQASVLLEAAMVRFAPWKPGDEMIIFP